MAEKTDISGDILLTTVAQRASQTELYLGMTARHVDKQVVTFLLTEASHIGHIPPHGGDERRRGVHAVRNDEESPRVEAAGQEPAALEVGDAGVGRDALPIGSREACHGVTSGIAHGLQQGVLAVMAHAGPLVAAREAQLAGPPAAHEEPRGAEKAEVVHRHHHRHARPSALEQGRRADEGIKVVHVHHVGPLAAQGTAQTAHPGWRIEPTGEALHTPPKTVAAAGRREAIESHLVPAGAEHGGHAVHHGFLAAGFAVVVMNDEDFHSYV